MGKYIIFILAFITISVCSKGAYVQINNLSGTASYGTLTATVTSTGSVSTWSSWCTTSYGTSYWAGFPPSSGSYTFTLNHPVYAIKVFSYALNGGTYGAGEYLQMTVNGSFYPLTAANMTSYTDCAGAGSGPCYLDAGLLYGPVGSTGDYDGGDFIITSCSGITSFDIYCNGILAGVTYYVFVDTTFANCFSANNNSAICLGDTLRLNAVGGDSTLPYTWYTPGGFTTTGKNVVIPSSTFADSGNVFVVQTTSAGIHDTAWTHVFIKPLPVVTAASNSPLCLSATNTLDLFATPLTVGETFSWTGPSGFTSAMENPVLTPFTAADTGWYYVITTLNGCSDSSKTLVVLNPVPPAPSITGKIIYCFNDPYLPFTVTGEPGATFLWYTSGTGGTGSTTPSSINTSVSGTTTVWVSQSVLGCEGPRDSITVTVLPPIVPSFTYAINRGCDYDTVYFTNTSTGFTSCIWNFGDATGNVSVLSPMHRYPAAYPYTNPFCFSGTVTLTDSNGHCIASVAESINTQHPLKAQYSISPDSICLGGSTNLNDASSGGGLSYSWNFGDGNYDATSGSVSHTYNTAGTFNTKLVITDSISCQDSASASVNVITFNIYSLHDTTLCLTMPFALYNYTHANYATDFVITHLWTPATGLTSDTAQAPYFSGFGNFTYILTDVIQPYGCIAYDTIQIHSLLGAKLTGLTDQNIKLGNSVQLNADNEVIYYWMPDDGTLSNPNINNPIATPSVTTTYTVYGRDIYGCIDSAYVTVHVDSTVTEFFPTAFSPNGDGLNDIFRPVGLTYQALLEFRVFNRWGQQVFYTNNKTVGWDGTFNGVPQDIGTYFYSIIIERPDTHENILYKGEVTLIR